MASTSIKINMAIMVLVFLLVAVSIRVTEADEQWSTCTCQDRSHKKCFGVANKCPPGCRSSCQMDCYLCKPVCPCDKPGAVCQDPRFIGGDGAMFYFHGKKNADFCLLSDHNLHINAHFIGKSRPNNRDFTWVQAIAVLTPNQNYLSLAAKKVGTWDNQQDQLAINFMGASITLPPGRGQQWQSGDRRWTITRSEEDTNQVVLELEQQVRMGVKVVPITAHESKVHNYGITNDDCFAHLDINFRFSHLTSNVSGVLGQTYAPNYQTPLKNLGATMPTIGGDENFIVSSLFSPDCLATRFHAPPSSAKTNIDLLTDAKMLRSKYLFDVSCSSAPSKTGVVCRR